MSQARGMHILCSSLCALLLYFSSSVVFAADDTLMQVRLEAVLNARATSNLKRKNVSGDLDAVDYYRDTAASLAKDIELLDLTARLEAAGKDIPDGFREDIDRTEESRALLLRQYDALEKENKARMVSGYSYYQRLYTLRMQEKFLAEQAARLTWESFNRPGGKPDRAQDAVWETKYLLYCNQRDADAAAYGQDSGAISRELYLDLLGGFNLDRQRLSARLELREKEADRFSAQKDGIIREKDFNAYFFIVQRLEELEKEIDTLSRDYEAGRVQFNDYKKRKLLLEQEREDLRAQRARYPNTYR